MTPICPPRRARILPAVTLASVVALAGLAGCSSSSTSATTTVPAATASATAGSCHYRLPAAPVRAVPVPGTPTDWNVTSFDGTVIRAHWFPRSAYVPGATGRYPTVLMGPGWSLAGDTDTSSDTNADQSAVIGVLPIRTLLDAGYNVLTWDPRGFGKSGGEAEVDSPDYEARDVSSLIDWISRLPGVLIDAPGDPRVGMIGGSYGGGIQLVTAATDCRVDAIVPTIAWNSLTTSLFKANTVKIGWSSILTNLTSSDHVDPEIIATSDQSRSTGTITPAEQAWFAARGPASLMGRITAPTLFLQGTVDTLFTLQEAVDNYQILRTHGVPTSMQWFCGGHGVCLTNPGNTADPVTATLAWLKRYLQRDSSVATGPGFTFVDQSGTTYTAPSYPVPDGRPFTATGTGTLPLVATGGAGPITSYPASQELGSLVEPITPAPATNAVDVPITFPRSGVIVGAPRLVLTYRGTVPAGVRPTRIFAQLVDTATGLVVGNQITPIDVTLDGKTHTVSTPLEIVAYTATPASHVELQLVATTVAYSTPRLGGSVSFSSIGLTLPVAATLTPSS